MKFIKVLLFTTFSSALIAQSYAPCANEQGSTAISKNSNLFQAWGTSVEIRRGWRDMADTSQGKADFGLPSNALFEPEGDIFSIVSLGDGGSATYYFENAIKNGFGADFAIFENGFTDGYIELAFIEVSNNGIDFYRFGPISFTQTQYQVSNANTISCHEVNNLAGKYRAGFGTPFDLEELVPIQGLDVNAVHYVRIIDVGGNIDAAYATYDALGNIINDPYPTAFENGGFDLDGIGVINQVSTLTIAELETDFVSIYPNPVRDFLNVKSEIDRCRMTIYQYDGKIIHEQIISIGESQINLNSVASGSYLIEFKTKSHLRRYNFQKQP